MTTTRVHAFPEALSRSVVAGRCLTALIAVGILTIVPIVHGAEDRERSDNAREEHNRLVETVGKNGPAVLPTLADAIASDSEVTRRTAAHLLARIGEPAQEILVRNLTHDDVQIRYIVVGALEELGVAGEYVEQLATDDEARIRRRFHMDILPEHLLVDGKAPDELIESLAAAYEKGSAQMRYEIIETVAELPLTEASVALLRRAADLEKAVAAVEAGKAKVGPVEKLSLIAYRVLLDRDIAKMRELAEAEKWRELADVLEDRDIGSWPDTPFRRCLIPRGAYANEPAEARYLLARAYYELGQSEKAERTLRFLMEEMDLGIGDRGERRFYVGILDLYRRNYEDHLRDSERARDWYVQKQFDYANRMTAARRKGEALESYRKVLRVEGLESGIKEDVHAAMEELNKD